MKAVSDIVDPNTGEVIAFAGDELDEDLQYRISVLDNKPEILSEPTFLSCPHCQANLLDTNSHSLIGDTFHCK